MLPSLIGVLAAAYSLEVLGPFLLVTALLMSALFELLALNRRTARARELSPASDT